MRPDEWDHILKGPKAPLVAILVPEVKSILERITGEPLSTSDLGRMIYAGGNRELMTMLQHMATRELSCFARRTPERLVRRFIGGKWIARKERPWAWSDYGTPNDETKGVHTCPKCGNVF